MKDPEAHWVQHYLLAGMHLERVEGRIGVMVRRATVERVARFVAGSGGAAS